VVLAAGESTRYGRLKQLDTLGPAGEALMDYALHDARRAGFTEYLFVVRPAIEPLLGRHLAPLASLATVRFLHQPTTARELEIDAPGAGERVWGTAVALLAVARRLDRPFALVNADDFYGRETLSLLARAVERAAEGPSARGALVGYRLAATVPAESPVSRAACRVGDDGELQHIEEITGVRREGPGYVGRAANGHVTLSGDLVVSMNAWAFPAGLADGLSQAFRAFAAGSGAPGAEFVLADAVNRLLASGVARFGVVPTGSQWFGVTAPADREPVRAALAKLVRAGVYPSPLPETRVDPDREG
jgi:hypothetical protein